MHIETGERVPVVGKITKFLKTPRAQRKDMAFNADNLRELFAGELVNGSGIKMTDLKKWAVLELWRELLKSRCANARPCPHHAHTMPTPCALRGHALAYAHACLFAFRRLLKREAPPQSLLLMSYKL